MFDAPFDGLQAKVDGNGAPSAAFPKLAVGTAARLRYTADATPKCVIGAAVGASAAVLGDAHVTAGITLVSVRISLAYIVIYGVR